MRGAVAGDLGASIQSDHPALDDVLTAFPVTLQLALASLLLASLLRRAVRRADRDAGRARASMPW